MSVPDYQTLMAPTLRALTDGEERPLAAIREAVATELELPDADRQATIPSGAPLFNNRVHWAITYMKQANLVRRPRRGIVQITDRGREVLQKHPDRVDNTVLTQFEEFNDFRNRSRRADTIIPDKEPRNGGTTPRETIAVAVEEANSAVAADALDRIRERDPAFLERLVLKVLTAMGYGGAADSTEHLGRSSDEGLDGIIRQDPLGLDRIYVQAKRYAADRTVGRPEVQAFVGALHGAQADRGVFITTSRFTPDAHTYAERVAARVILVDGPTLARRMVTHNVGIQDEEFFVIKRVDEDFFEDT